MYPHFAVTVRDGMHGKVVGHHQVRRTPERDELYDSWQVVKRASYYGGKRPTSNMVEDGDVGA